MSNFVLVYLSIFLSTCVLFAYGKRVEGNLITSKNWQFITRFCFLSKKGTLEYFFEYPKNYETQSLLLYFDNKWDEVYNVDPEKDCKEKVDVLSLIDNQIIPLNTNGAGNCTEILKPDNTSYYRCLRKVTFSSSREKWWFIAIGNCLSTKGLSIVYRFHMMNGEDDELLFHELSADQFYIFPILISFFLVYLIIGVISSAIGKVLSTKQLFHTTYKMYIFSIYTNCFGVFVLVIGWGKYANTGYEEKGAWLAGRLFQSISDITFVLMLLLMANGYTIVKGRLSTKQSVALAVFFCLFTLTYAILFIYEAESFDPGKVLYIYESPAGYGLIALRLIGWAFFCVSIIVNLVRHSRKTWFYVPFCIYYTTWFWTGPITILIAMFVINLWVREQIVVGVSNFVTLCGHLFFLLLTRPGAANKRFPYHIRTTQIGMMDGTEKETNATNTYEVETMNTHGPDLQDLFVTDRKSYISKETTTSSKPKSEKNGTLPPLTNGHGNKSPPLGKLPLMEKNEALPPINNNFQIILSAQPSYEMFLVGGSSKQKLVADD